MEHKVKILILFILIIRSEVISSTSFKNVLLDIEVNQALGMDCSTYSNSIDNFINEYKQMYDSLNIVCQIHLKSAAGKLKSTVDQMVNQKLDDYIANVEGMKSKLIEMKKYSYLYSIETLDMKYQQDIGILNKNISKCIGDVAELQSNLTEINIKREILDHSNIISAIKSGDFPLGHELLSKTDNADLNSLIAELYSNDIRYASLVIEFLNSFQDDERTIYGYHLLFNQMRKNNQIYSTPATSIAYRVFVNYNQKYLNNKHLNYLRSNLPESLKTFLWNQTILIQNFKFNASIWVYDSRSYYYDNIRYIPFLNLINQADDDLTINIIPTADGKYFYMKTNQKDHYLYAESDEFDLDGERRAVFIWRQPNEIKETGIWQIEPILGSQQFKIKNMFWNEYLSAIGSVKVKGYTYLQIFTLKSGVCDDNYCKWNFLKYIKP